MTDRMDNKPLKVQAIINPVSGVGSKVKIPSMIKDIYEREKAALKVTFTEYAGHASELTKQAIADGARVIIAVGGDGTVNEIARSMIYSDATLGIIPKGSGNGLARDLHIPMDTRRALEMIVRGHAITIDGCKANERVFFTTCGVGFDAAVSKKFANEKRRGSLTYVKNILEEYLSYEPEAYELLLDDRQLKEKAFLVACANASQYGNNAYIAPHANIQDGKMNVTILSPFTPLDIAPLAIQLFTKQIERNSKIKIIKASKLTIIRQKKGIMHLDGEPVEAGRRIDISVLPQALKVLTPEKVSFTEEVKGIFEQVTRFLDERIPYTFRLI